MDKKIKAMLKINDVLDDRYQKLCDQYHELELSHKRKKKALEKLLTMFLRMYELIDERGEPWIWYPPAVLYCFEICHEALFSDGRVKERSMVKKKAKGGAK